MITDVACRRKDCEFNTRGKGCGTCKLPKRKEGTCKIQVLKINGNGQCTSYKKMVGLAFIDISEE